MRRNRENQLPLTPLWPDHQLGEELRMISRILDENPQVLDPIVQDLSDSVDAAKGSPGLSAEQVLRCAVLKQWHQLSYSKLAFHLADSMSFRAFCRLPLAWTPSKSCLQENVSRIGAASWDRINAALVGWAKEQGLEKGEKVRIDSTTVDSEIAYPTDSGLLYDSIRKVTSLLRKGAGRHKTPFSDHCRRAKRRVINIRNSRGMKAKRKWYRDLLQAARLTWGYGWAAAERLQRDEPADPLLQQLLHFLELMRRVIEQTERRVLKGEKVPAKEKVVSVFEEHSDIIEKGKRETVFGHKIFLTCGKSSLILDCLTVRGNPADVCWTETLLKRCSRRCGAYPRQASLDGGFASQDNLKWAKEQGVQDVAFAKKCGLKVSDMVRSSWVYKQLRRFRAGIEGCISTLKRVFGAGRCSWKGWEHFQQYVQLSVVSYNLLVLARLRL